MKPKTKQSHESVVRKIKRKTRRRFNSEEKIRIILEGLKAEDSIANICCREGIAPSLYYKWRKSFILLGLNSPLRGELKSGACRAVAWAKTGSLGPDSLLRLNLIALKASG